jgi:hypothetical protein
VAAPGQPQPTCSRCDNSPTCKDAYIAAGTGVGRSSAHL